MCKFMSLAHAQVTVSRLQQGPNENGWPASSDPCVCVCGCVCVGRCVGVEVGGVCIHVMILN